MEAVQAGSIHSEFEKKPYFVSYLISFKLILNKLTVVLNCICYLVTLEQAIDFALRLAT